MRHDSDTWATVEALARSDGRYSEYAFLLVLSSVEMQIRMIGEKRHISGEELLEGVRVMATRQYGPMAKEVLNHWGVYSTRDIGMIVFALIDAGLLEAGDDDSLEHFEDGYDFKRVFEDDYYRG